MSTINFSTINRWLTIEHLVHGVMVVFALASVGNLVEFMSHGHNAITAWGVGLALGGGLVAVSIMFTKVDIHDAGTFWPMLAAMLAMGLLSGGMQTIAYHATEPLWVAALQGFGFPLVGECLLAYASAMFAHSERKRRQAQADEQIEQRIADAIDDAMRTIDVSGAKRHVEKAAEQIVKSKMSALLAARIGTQPATETGNFLQTAETGRPDIAELNAERQRQIAERRGNILHLFATYGEMGASDLQSRLQDDCNVKTSERTVRDDLAALVDDGELMKSGRGRWDVSRAIAEALPTMEAPVLNGVAH